MCIFGPGVIRFGLPSWCLLAGFLPAALVFLITMIAAPVSGAVKFHTNTWRGCFCWLWC